MTRAEAIHAAWTARVPKAVYYERDGENELPALICQGDEAAIMEHAGRFDALVAKVAPGGEVVS